MRISFDVNLGKSTNKIPSSPANSEAVQTPSILDFESSPLRFEYDALLEEYRTLWAEICTRVSDQQQIVNYAITLVTAFFAVSQLLMTRSSFSVPPHYVRMAYAFLTILFSSFAVLYQNQCTMMVDIGIYINEELRPRMERILATTQNTPRVWQWNEWRNQLHFRKFPNNLAMLVMSGSGFLITFLPAPVFASLFLVNRQTNEPFTISENVILILVLLSVACAVFGAIYSLARVRKLGSARIPDDFLT